MKKKNVVSKKVEPEYPKVFETFRELGDFEISLLKREESSCFNGVVNVEKYKIEIEKVEEPVRVIIGRLQKLWDECDNFHHWEPLRAKAAQFGYKFPNSPGTKRNK